MVKLLLMLLAGLLLYVVSTFVIANLVMLKHGDFYVYEPTDSMLLKINKIREDAFESSMAFKENMVLDLTAKAKACDIVESKYWSHTTPDGVQFYEPIAKAGYDYYGVGEIIARNCKEDRCIQLWMESPTHRTQILERRFNEFGIGRCGRVVVIHFGSRKSLF